MLLKLRLLLRRPLLPLLRRPSLLLIFLKLQFLLRRPLLPFLLPAPRSWSPLVGLQERQRGGEIHCCTQQIPESNDTLIPANE